MEMFNYALLYEVYEFDSRLGNLIRLFLCGIPITSWSTIQSDLHHIKTKVKNSYKMSVKIHVK
jgi:hypothetical protein